MATEKYVVSFEQQGLKELDRIVDSVSESFKKLSSNVKKTGDEADTALVTVKKLIQELDKAAVKAAKFKVGNNTDQASATTIASTKSIPVAKAIESVIPRENVAASRALDKVQTEAATKFGIAIKDLSAAMSTLRDFRTNAKFDGSKLSNQQFYGMTGLNQYSQLPKTLSKDASSLTNEEFLKIKVAYENLQNNLKDKKIKIHFVDDESSKKVVDDVLLYGKKILGASISVHFKTDGSEKTVIDKVKLEMQREFGGLNLGIGGQGIFDESLRKQKLFLKPLPFSQTRSAYGKGVQFDEKTERDIMRITNKALDPYTGSKPFGDITRARNKEMNSRLKKDSKAYDDLMDSYIKGSEEIERVVNQQRDKVNMSSKIAASTLQTKGNIKNVLGVEPIQSDTRSGVTNVVNQAQTKAYYDNVVESARKQSSIRQQSIAGWKQEIDVINKAKGAHSEFEKGFHVSRIAGYFAAWKAFDLIINTVKETMIDLQSEEKNLFAVTNYGARDMASSFDAINAIAVATGSTMQDVAKTFIIATRSISNYSSASERVKKATELTLRAEVLANIAAIDRKEAIDDLIGITNQWNVSSDEQVRIMDQIASVAKTTPAAIDDYTRSLALNGDALSDVGVSIEETIGLTAVLKKSFASVSSTEVANKLGRIVEYIKSDKAQAAIEDIGVAYTTLGATGEREMRPIIDIMKDINEKTKSGEISAAQFGKLMNDVGKGSRGAKDMSAAIKGIDEALEIANSAASAPEGVAGRINEERVKSLKETFTGLYAAIQGVASEMLNAKEGGTSIASTIATVVKNITSLVKSLKDLSPLIKTLILGLGVKKLFGFGIDEFNLFNKQLMIYQETFKRLSSNTGVSLGVKVSTSLEEAKLSGIRGKIVQAITGTSGGAGIGLAASAGLAAAQIAIPILIVAVLEKLYDFYTKWKDFKDKLQSEAFISIKANLDPETVARAQSGFGFTGSERDREIIKKQVDIYKQLRDEGIVPTQQETNILNAEFTTLIQTYGDLDLAGSRVIENLKKQRESMDDLAKSRQNYQSAIKSTAEIEKIEDAINVIRKMKDLIKERYSFTDEDYNNLIKDLDPTVKRIVDEQENIFRRQLKGFSFKKPSDFLDDIINNLEKRQQEETKNRDLAADGVKQLDLLMKRRDEVEKDALSTSIKLFEKRGDTSVIDKVIDAQLKTVEDFADRKDVQNKGKELKDALQRISFTGEDLSLDDLKGLFGFQGSIEEMIKSLLNDPSMKLRLDAVETYVKNSEFARSTTSLQDTLIDNIAKITKSTTTAANSVVSKYIDAEKAQQAAITKIEQGGDKFGLPTEVLSKLYTTYADKLGIDVEGVYGAIENQVRESFSQSGITGSELNQQVTKNTASIMKYFDVIGTGGILDQEIAKMVQSGLITDAEIMKIIDDQKLKDVAKKDKNMLLETAIDALDFSKDKNIILKNIDTQDFDKTVAEINAKLKYFRENLENMPEFKKQVSLDETETAIVTDISKSKEFKISGKKTEIEWALEQATDQSKKNIEQMLEWNDTSVKDIINIARGIEAKNPQWEKIYTEIQTRNSRFSEINIKMYEDQADSWDKIQKAIDDNKIDPLTGKKLQSNLISPERLASIKEERAKSDISNQQLEISDTALKIAEEQYKELQEANNDRKKLLDKTDELIKQNEKEKKVDILTKNMRIAFGDFAAAITTPVIPGTVAGSTGMYSMFGANNLSGGFKDFQQSINVTVYGDVKDGDALARNIGYAVEKKVGISDSILNREAAINSSF